MDFSTPAEVVRTQQRADAKVDRLAAGASRELANLVTGTALGAIPLDPTRIGLLGYSFGGAIAAETARRDARVRAAVNLDGWMFGSAARAGVPRPYLVIGTGLPQLDASPTPWAAPAGRSLEQRFDLENERRIIAGLERHGGYFACIDGTRHAAFSDAGDLPLRFGRPGGPLGGRSARRIIRTLVGQFCDRFIAGLPAPLFDRRPEPAAGRDVEFDPYLRWIVRRLPLAGG
jgi:pimeloyl-ACP methyl ester carboxylesterase